MEELKKINNPNPLLNAGIISKTFFCWLNPLFRLGKKRKLEVNDLYNIETCHSSEVLCDKLQSEWNKELLKISHNRKPSLFKAIFKTFGLRFLLLGLIAFFEEAVKIFQPIFLGLLISYFNPKSAVPTWKAYSYAVGVSVCVMLLAFLHHPYFYGVSKIGMQIRVACCSMIYKKMLKLSNHSLGQTTTGQIVNLLSNDVVRFDQAPLFLHYLWIGPIQSIAVFFILWHRLGAASLSGFAMLILLLPIQGFMGRLFSKLRRKTAKETDERVRIMNEVLTGIRVIKMYCWEKLFGELVQKVRSKEIKLVKFASYGRAFFQAQFFVSSTFIAYVTFLHFVLSGNNLTAETIFVTISLYNPIRLVIHLFMPYAITMASESTVTLNRIQNFLMLEELEMKSSISYSTPNDSPHKPIGINASNVSASWLAEVDQQTLDNVSVQVNPGELIAVVGPVGSGKSSLLMSILGELPISSGSVDVCGSIAYAAQQPWIFSGSLKQNILFGKELNPQKYQEVLEATDLLKDLSLMPDGDLTVVGERGISLSGGQKARVSLARSLYVDADVYLLDDPLSAVDFAVGQHLFEKCICGFLTNKPRILVTHQLQYLKSADKIIILKKGKIELSGTFDELADSGVDFSILLKRDVKETDDKAPKSLQIENLLPKDRNSKVGFVDDQPKKDVDNEYVQSKRSLQEQISFSSLDIPRPSKLLSKSFEQIGSVISLGSITNNMMPERVEQGFEEPGCNMVAEEENRIEGTVAMHVYWKYFTIGANAFVLMILFILNILAQTSHVMCDYWLSYWILENEKELQNSRDTNSLLLAGVNSTISYFDPNDSLISYDHTKNVIIYSSIVISSFVLSLSRALLSFKVLVNSSKNLHRLMFNSIIRCPVLFFDNNPVGRILNRFSKDMGLLDETLPLTMFDFIQCALLVISIVILSGIINPWVFIPVVPLLVVFIFLRRYYMITSRHVKRLEATTRSPVFTHLSASLQGLQTIRAFRAQHIFMKEFDFHQDTNTSAFFIFLSTTRWFAIRLDWLCASFVSMVAFLSVISSERLNAGLVGLTLSYAMGLMGLFQWAVRQSTEVENQMTSVERVIEYSNLDSEAELDSKPAVKPTVGWPQKGTITCSNTHFRYSNDAPFILKNLTFKIEPFEKIGIVGRTGAGKSSLIAMLFRLAEPSGNLKIDNVDILRIGLHDLRKHISIIPQDPVLFTGTIRKNLDPFELHCDLSLWNALKETQMKDTVENLPGSLQTQISEGGSNFSVGQRQLICLARAILLNNPILVIDEATANVDPLTDSLIQQTIREKFKHCTVLTIAHRLNTIIDSDRIMVLEEGRIHEFDEPWKLLEDPDSLLLAMVNQSSVTESEHLKHVAKQKCSKKSLDLQFSIENSENNSDFIDQPNSHTDKRSEEKVSLLGES